MGGFADVLGHAAIGFEQSRQQDLQRQFESEQNRRAQIAGLLQHIATSDSAHPYSRNAAVQTYLEMAKTPGNKAFKFDADKLIAPPESQTPASFTPPANPPLTMGGMTISSAPPRPTSLAPQAGIFQSPEQQTALAAQRAGQVTGAQTSAQASAEGGPPIMKYGPNGEMQTVIPSKTPGQTFDNTFNPMAIRGMAAIMHPVTVEDPVTHLPVPAIQNKLTREVYGSDGEVIPNAVVFAPSLLGHTGTESMSTSGAITRKSTPTPRGGAQKAGTVTGSAAPPQLSAPPAPMMSGSAPTGQAGVAGAVPQGSPNAPTVQTPPAVSLPTGAKAARPRAAGGGPAAMASKLPQTPEELQAIKDPVTREAYDWAMLGQKPTGSTMAVRQVEQRMNQLGLAKALPVPPALQRKIQFQFQMRNSAINLIDDIKQNKSVLNSLLSAGKVAIGSDPKTGDALVTRAAGLTDQEARVAGDFAQLVEHANLLREPLGATGFRSKESWNALQQQRGNPLADPRITDQVMTGMRMRLASLNSADKLVLSGQGMDSSAGAPQTSGHQVGEVVTVRGNKIKITAIHDDGSFDGEPVK